MDEATSALDEPGQANIMRLLAEELPHTAVVSIGHRPGLEQFHSRIFVLEPGRSGAQLRPRRTDRSLRDIYRKMAAASRGEPMAPSFWSSFGAGFRQTLVGR
jgi:putative ATP-binding cassette transporter